MNGAKPDFTGAVQVFEPEPDGLYSVEAAAHLAGVTRRTVLLYCKLGVVRPARDPGFGPLQFTEQSIQSIRQAERLRDQHGINLTGIRMIFELLREVESLRQKLQFFRG